MRQHCGPCGALCREKGQRSVAAEPAFPRAACGERRICSRARGAPSRHRGAALTNAVLRTAAAGPGLPREGALALDPQRPHRPRAAPRPGPVGGGWAAVGAGAQLCPAEAVRGGWGGRAHSRSAPRHWPRRRAGQHVTGGAVAAAALAQQLGAGGAERPGRALAAAGWRRGGRGHGVSTGGSTGRLPAVPLRGCCKAVKAAGGEEKAAFVARKTGQGERAGAAGKGDGRHPRRRAAASRAGLATGTKPPRSAPRPRGGSFRGAAVAAPLCRCRAETARGAGRREAEPRGARSR